VKDVSQQGEKRLRAIELEEGTDSAEGDSGRSLGGGSIELSG